MEGIKTLYSMFRIQDSILTKKIFKIQNSRFNKSMARNWPYGKII
jgi:hypothetical protein